MRVVDAQLRPVAGAWLEARGPLGAADLEDGYTTVRAHAGPGGRVQLGGLSRGRWSLAAGAPGFGRLELGAVRVDEAPQDYGDAVLAEEAVLEVEAFDPLRGPRAGLLIELLDVYGADPRPARRADDILLGPDPQHATDARGVLRIGGLAAGTYRVRVRGAPDELVVRVTLRPQRITRVIVIAPPPAPVQR
jgi:hypothetical protein